MRRFTIGRSETNEIVIPDASVSRHHAELAELGDGRFALRDLGSTYGTQVWLGERWIAAADTELRADTVVRFGEYQTTLMEVLNEAQRAALGLIPPPPPAQAAPAPETAVPPPPAPRPASPETVGAPGPRAAAPATREIPAPPKPPDGAPPAPRAAPVAPPETPRRPATEHRPARLRAMPARSGNKRKSVMIGLVGLSAFTAIAGIAVAAILLFGEADPPPRPEAPANTANAQAQARMLDACTKEWEVPERRCRCFLAAAGPHLLAEDYDDYAEMLQAYMTGDTDRQESALQRAVEKRGAPASSRLTAAFKSAVRDCQQ